jgi:hypothetical protein
VFISDIGFDQKLFRVFYSVYVVLLARVLVRGSSQHTWGVSHMLDTGFWVFFNFLESTYVVLIFFTGEILIHFGLDPLGVVRVHGIPKNTAVFLLRG